MIFDIIPYSLLAPLDPYPGSCVRPPSPLTRSPVQLEDEEDVEDKKDEEDYENLP